LDKIDLAIIDKLTEDARMSFRKISRELGVSPDTVTNRYTALQKEGAIRGSTIVLDPHKIGYQAMAVFVINTAPTHILPRENNPPDSSMILDRLIRMPNIIVAAKSVGDHDLIAISVVMSFEHLIKVRDDIARIPGVKDLQVSFWVKDMEICPKYFIV
jgi:Lrp/AsnC family leucine-responsive transcriptional regulator